MSDESLSDWLLEQGIEWHPPPAPDPMPEPELSQAAKRAAGWATRNLDGKGNLETPEREARGLPRGAREAVPSVARALVLEIASRITLSEMPLEEQVADLCPRCGQHMVSEIAARLVWLQRGGEASCRGCGTSKLR